MATALFLINLQLVAATPAPSTWLFCDDQEALLRTLSATASKDPEKIREAAEAAIQAGCTREDPQSLHLSELPVGAGTVTYPEVGKVSWFMFVASMKTREAKQGYVIILAPQKTTPGIEA